MSRAQKVPSRGDLVWLSFDPRSGHEQAGRRPAFVLSPAAYNSKTGLLLACPVTSRSKGYPFEVSLPEGLPLAGVILADQVRSLDWRARQAEIACAAPAGTLDEVVGKLLALIDA